MDVTKRRGRAAQASAWNAGRDSLLDAILCGSAPTPGHPDGWLVSRHTEIRSTHTVMARLRKRHPRLVFKVRNTRDDSVPWDGAIYAKRRADAEVGPPVRTGAGLFSCPE